MTNVLLAMNEIFPQEMSIEVSVESPTKTPYGATVSLFELSDNVCIAVRLAKAPGAMYVSCVPYILRVTRDVRPEKKVLGIDVIGFEYISIVASDGRLTNTFDGAMVSTQL